MRLSVTTTGSEIHVAINGNSPASRWCKNSVNIIKFAVPLNSNGISQISFGLTLKSAIENGNATQMIVTRKTETAPIVRISSCLSQGPGCETCGVAITAINRNAYSEICYDWKKISGCISI